MFRYQSRGSAGISRRVMGGAIAALLSVGLLFIALRERPLDRSPIGAHAESFTPIDGANQIDRAEEATAAEPFSLAYVPRDAVAVAAVRPAALLKRRTLAPLKNTTLLQEAKLHPLFGLSADRFEQVTAVFLLDKAGSVGMPATFGWSRSPTASLVQTKSPGGGETWCGPGDIRINGLFLGGSSSTREPVVAGLILQLAESKDVDSLLEAMQPNPEEHTYAGQAYVNGVEGSGWNCFRAGERVVVASEKEEYLRRLIIAGNIGASRSKWARDWKFVANADAALFVNSAASSAVLNAALIAEIMEDPLAQAKNGVIAHLWQSSSNWVLSADCSDDLTVKLRIAVANETDAGKVRESLAAVVTLGQNVLTYVRKTLSEDDGPEGAMELSLVDSVDALLDSVTIKQRIEQSDSIVNASAVIQLEEPVQMVVRSWPAVKNARDEAQRRSALYDQMAWQLSSLAQAMQKYHEEHESFPPAVLHGPDGKTTYSWRVALLPYLGNEELYKEYKFDEPWDGPNNKALLAKIPSAFQAPAGPDDSNLTAYFALTGPSTIFSGAEGKKLDEITDGVANTVMFVEANRDVPWTKPEDIPYGADFSPTGAPVGEGATPSTFDDATRLRSRLGGHIPGLFLVTFCDGRVESFSQKINPARLHAIITPNGGDATDELQPGGAYLPTRATGPNQPPLFDPPPSE